MSKKFKALIDDSGLGVRWEVWGVTPNPNGHSTENCVYALFFGKHCGQYAKAHAKMLNALPKEEKP